MSTALLFLHASHWLAAFLLFGMAAYGLKFRRQRMILALTVFCALAGIWAICSAIIFLTPDFKAKILLNRIKLVAPATLPLSILAMAMAMQGRRKWHKYAWVVFALVPAISLVLLISPAHHELFIGNYSLINRAGHELLAFSNGPWFAIHDINARFVVLTTIILLIWSSWDLTPTHRYRVWLVIIAIAVPFVVDTVAVHLWELLRFMQITPTMLLLSAVLMIYASLRKHLINVIPFARGHILDSIGDVYLVFDVNQLLVDFNVKACKIFNLTRRQIGTSVKALSEISAPLCDLLSVPFDSTHEWSLNDEFYEASRHVLLDPHKEHIGSILACRDITLRKQTEQSLQELSEIKTKLLAVIGHDFQGNLAASLIIAQTLLRSGGKMDGDNLIQAYRNIEKISVENISLVEALLDWSKHRLGSQNAYDNVNLGTLLEETRAFLQPLMDGRQVSIEWGGVDASPVLMDGSSLKTILRNLLTNAIKASHAHSVVMVDVTRSAGFVQISVTDHGLGIEKDLLPELFKFKKEKNSGIGLFLCHEFVKSLQGTIHVESELGVGSCFRVSLPFAIAPIAQKSVFGS